MHSSNEDDHGLPSSSGHSDTENDRMIAIILSEEYSSINHSIGHQVSDFAPTRVSHHITYSF